jgi:Zn-dependent peptidase ImmA (M78 family)
LTRNILEAVDKAREFFEIEDFPGDFFARLEEVDYTNKYDLLLFKEDIDKLSGFIGYGLNDMAVICVNYKRSQGYQNFTLAHEVGHWFLHKGKSLSDDDSVLGYSSDSMEQEANEFAGELLYPETYLVRDYYVAIQQDLFFAGNRIQLGRYVDELCHKYCLSFEMVLRRLLYKNKQGKQYRKVRKEIEKALGGKVSESFDRDFYAVNEDLPQYQKFMKPYKELQKKVDYLVETGKIGKATGESIKLRNGVKID